MMLRVRSLVLFFFFLAFCSSAWAFVAPTTTSSRVGIVNSPWTRQQPNVATSTASTTTTTTTALSERRWNFNEGQSPWGLKKNAEIWNGRVAQMAFVLTFLQELIQGKGAVQGITEGDPVNLAALGAFAVTVVGLTAWLAIQGDDDYVARDMKNKKI